MGSFDRLSQYSRGRDVDAAINQATGVVPQAQAQAATALAMQQQQAQQEALASQKAYQQQQAIESSPQFMKDTLDYYRKNPKDIQYEENPKVKAMLINSGLIKKPSGFSALFGFGK